MMELSLRIRSTFLGENVKVLAHEKSAAKFKHVA